MYFYLEKNPHLFNIKTKLNDVLYFEYNSPK